MLRMLIAYKRCASKKKHEVMFYRTKAKFNGSPPLGLFHKELCFQVHLEWPNLRRLRKVFLSLLYALSSQGQTLPNRFCGTNFTFTISNIHVHF